MESNTDQRHTSFISKMVKGTSKVFIDRVDSTLDIVMEQESRRIIAAGDQK